MENLPHRKELKELEAMPNVEMHFGKEATECRITGVEGISVARFFFQPGTKCWYMQWRNDPYGWDADEVGEYDSYGEIIHTLLEFAKGCAEGLKEEMLDK